MSNSGGLEAVQQTLIGIIEDLSQDWGIDLDEPMSGNTLLVQDMQFASVDIIQLVVAIEEHYQRPKMGFQDLLMQDGSYVEDLSVAQIAQFVHEKLSGAAA